MSYLMKLRISFHKIQYIVWTQTLSKLYGYKINWTLVTECIFLKIKQNYRLKKKNIKFYVSH